MAKTIVHSASNMRWMAIAIMTVLLFGCNGQTITFTGPTTLGALVDALLVDNTTIMDDELPDNAYCAAVSTWSQHSAEFEDDVFRLVNINRAAGADCGSTGSFDRAAPLAENAALRCAARNHSLDMATRNFFSHTNPDGNGSRERMDQAGYGGFAWGENIAFGQTSPAQVVDGWMHSSGHCANIMNPNFTEIGIGHDPSNQWTQVFGAR